MPGQMVLERMRMARLPDFIGFLRMGAVIARLINQVAEIIFHEYRALFMDEIIADMDRGLFRKKHRTA